MTDRYYNKGIAPKLSLTCPHCSAEARFESLYGDLPLPVMLADDKTGTRLSCAGRPSLSPIPILRCRRRLPV